MNFEYLYQRTTNILLNPFETWNEIKTERKSRKDIISGFLLPVSVIIGICSLLGTLFFSKIENSFSFGYVLFNGIISFLVIFLEVYFSCLLIAEITTSFSQETDADAVFALVTYSQTPFFVALAITKLFPQLLFLTILSIYTLYLFWIGIIKLLNVQEDKRIIFLLLSSLVLILIFLLLSVVFNSFYDLVLSRMASFEG